MLERPRFPLPLAALLAAVFLAACEDDPVVPPTDDDPDVTSVQVVDTAGPIFRSLRVELDSAADVEVFYQPIGGGRTFRMTTDDASRSHDVLLPRLLADTTYRYVVRTHLGATTSDSVVRGTFATEPLPADLAEIEYSVEGTATFPLLVFSHTVDGSFDGVIAMQTDGSIVWYSTAAGSAGAPDTIPGSHDMVFLSRAEEAVVRVSPRDRIVASMRFDRIDGAGVHHDLAVLDESRVALIARDDRTVRDTVVRGEAIWIWDMETDALEKVWSAWDFFDWDEDRGARSIPDDWLHANSLSVGPRGNLILSLHFLNQIVSIAPDFQTVEWRLGGLNATIGVAPEDQFTGQHSATELPGGRVLLFDNRYETEEPSRALELLIDGDSADVVWEYVAEPPLRSPIWSGVYDLDNGNRVASFPVPASRQPPGGAPPFTVDEVTPAAQRVWRLTGPGLTPSFRGVPWRSIAGEEPVDAMP